LPDEIKSWTSTANATLVSDKQGGYETEQSKLFICLALKISVSKKTFMSDIAHHHKIVTALSETIRLMAEIDQVLETHGDWPGAFQTPSA
jgi:hypothetical protein